MEFIEVKWTILYVLLVTVGSRNNKQWLSQKNKIPETCRVH